MNFYNLKRRGGENRKGKETATSHHPRKRGKGKKKEKAVLWNFKRTPGKKGRGFISSYSRGGRGGKEFHNILSPMEKRKKRGGTGSWSSIVAVRSFAFMREWGRKGEKGEEDRSINQLNMEEKREEKMFY